MQGKAVVLGLLLFVIGLIIGASPIIPAISKQTVTVTKSTLLTVTETETITKTKTIQKFVKTTKAKWFVCFSPKGRCANLLIYWINKANKSIHVMIYSFTLDEVANALIDAKNRDLDVKVVIEQKQADVKGSEFERLKKNGIKVRVDGNPALMHNKVTIIDGFIIIAGSYNYSSSAENRNDENLIVLFDKELASLYERRFEMIWDKAKERI